MDPLDNSKERKSWDLPGLASTSLARLSVQAAEALLCGWWNKGDVIDYELLEPSKTLVGSGTKLNWGG